MSTKHIHCNYIVLHYFIFLTTSLGFSIYAWLEGLSSEETLICTCQVEIWFWTSMGKK